MKTAAIVLAGGRSSRFGRDKLVEPIDGRPMLELAVDAVRPFVDEVLIVVAPEATPTALAGTRLVRDATAYQGPLAGVAAGLAATDADVVLVVGGDMPSMVPAVLARLIATLDRSAVDAVVLDGRGARRPLPMAVRRSIASTLAVTLLAGGERRLRALRDGLALAVVPDAEWRRDDPERRTLRDIDTIADLG